MKKDICCRGLSLLLALVMVLSLPAAAVEGITAEAQQETAGYEQEAESTAAPEEAVQEETAAPEETVTQAQPAQAQEEPAQEQTEQPAGEQEEAKPESVPGLTESAAAQNAVESQQAPEAAVYVDAEGRYLAPEELTAYRTLTMDAVLKEGEQEPAPKAEDLQEEYTGVVAFYDYNEPDEQTRFAHPFFFYYQDGRLQKEQTEMIAALGWLDLRCAPVEQADGEDETVSRLVYTGREVYVQPEAEEHREYLFAFNREDMDNGLFSGTFEDKTYENGLAVQQQEEEPARAETENHTVAASAAETGVQVEWGFFTDAKAYRVFRSTDGGEAEVLADVVNNENLTYLDESAQSGERYVYSVRGYKGNKDLMSADTDYTQTGTWTQQVSAAPIVYLAAPAVSLSSDAKKITVAWSMAQGAESYLVWRSEEGGEWVTLSETPGLVYADTQAQSGKHYFYRVQAKAGESLSAETDPRSDSGNAICLHAVPALTAVVEKSGVSLKWTQDKSATGYRLMRRAAGEKSWTVMKDITSPATVTYVDNGAVNGTQYTYGVRAYYGDVKNMAQSDEASTVLWGAVAEKNVTYLSFESVYSVSGGLMLKWKAVKGVSGYQINYRTSPNGKWLALTDVGNTTSYTLKNVKNGTGYYLALRTYTKDKSGKKVCSGWTIYKTPEVYHAPLKVEVSVLAKGVKISWNVDARATGYRVYRNANGKNVAIANQVVSKGSTAYYLDQSTLANNTVYFYTVRPYYGKQSLAAATTAVQDQWGAYVWVKYQYMSAPVLSAVSNYYTGSKLDWKAVKGAAGYYIYRKDGEKGAWKRIGVVSKGSVVSYIDTSAAKLKSGTPLSYTVRAYGSSKQLGGYDYEGLKLYYLAKPATVKVAQPSASGTAVSWSAVPGATSYYIYRRKGSSGAWTLLGAVAGQKYVDKNVTNRNTVYVYTIRASAKYAKKNYLSAFERAGYSFGIVWNGKERNSWVKKNGNIYYVDKSGYCLTGWHYLSRNGKQYKYFFEPLTGVLVTNLYSKMGVKARELIPMVEVQLSSDDDYPGHATILLFDKTTNSFCIPAVTFRCVGNISLTRVYGSSAYMSAGAGIGDWAELVDDSGIYERYATRIKGTPSYFHSVLYNSPRTKGIWTRSYNNLVRNVNDSSGCIRLQCVFAYLIQDIMKNGYGKDHRVTVEIYHNKKDTGPFGIPQVDTIDTSYDPTDPAYTGKFFYATQLKEGDSYIRVTAGSPTWSYY